MSEPRLQRMEKPATSDAPAKDPDMPAMCRIGDLVVRLGFTVARFTTDWVAKRLHLSMAVVRELMVQLCREGLMEELWQTGVGSSHYKITQRGREHATRLLEVCGYIGPAPVALEAYAAMLRWQFANSPQVTPQAAAASL